MVFEAELGIVIGRRCAGVSVADAPAAIFGYTCVNDVTARDLMRLDPTLVHWTRAKGFDSFGVFGPVIATGLDPAGLRVRAVVAGEQKQDYAVADMFFSPHEIVSPHETSGEFAGVVFPVILLVTSRLSLGGRMPATHRWWGVHWPYGTTGGFQRQPICRRPLSADCSFAKALRSADEVGETGLSQIHPLLVNPVAVAHQDAFPILYESRKKSCNCVTEMLAVTLVS